MPSWGTSSRTSCTTSLTGHLGPSRRRTQGWPKAPCWRHSGWRRTRCWWSRRWRMKAAAYCPAWTSHCSRSLLAAPSPLLTPPRGSSRVRGHPCHQQDPAALPDLSRCGSGHRHCSALAHSLPLPPSRSAALGLLLGYHTNKATCPSPAHPLGQHNVGSGRAGASQPLPGVTAPLGTAMPPQAHGHMAV